MIEVPKFQYNFENLEAHMLTFALEKKFSSIIAVDEFDYDNIVSNSIQKDIYLVHIHKIMENNHHIFTQEIMLPSNSNKTVKKSFVKKLLAKKKRQQNYLVHSLIRKW